MEIPRGVSKAQFFKGKYDTKRNFRRGGGSGSSYKTFCGMGMDIFWNSTMRIREKMAKRRAHYFNLH